MKYATYFFAISTLNFSLCAMEADNDPHGSQKRFEDYHAFCSFESPDYKLKRLLVEDWKANGNFGSLINLDKNYIEGHTPLGYAARYIKNPQFITYLINQGASINAECIGSDDEHKVHKVIFDVVKGGSPGILDMFKKKGIFGKDATNAFYLTEWELRKLLCYGIKCFSSLLKEVMTKKETIQEKSKNYLSCLETLLDIMIEKKCGMQDPNDSNNDVYEYVVNSRNELLIQLFLSKCNNDFNTFVESKKNKKKSIAQSLLSTVGLSQDSNLLLVQKVDEDQQFKKRQKMEQKQKQQQLRKKRLVGYTLVSNRILTHLTNNLDKFSCEKLTEIQRH